MNSKRFIRLSLCLTLILLILTASVQIAIDPLFQYHKPWFGMMPVVEDERYQNAGIAKNFDYDNVLIGNSLASNIRVSDISELFGGNSVKLTMLGSHTIDWTYLLELLKDKHPDHVMMNLDPGILYADPYKMKHELPQYLYDDIYVNDVNYWFNFSIINENTIETVSLNAQNKVPDYNNVFIYNEDRKTNKESVINNYDRSEKKDLSNSYDELLSTAESNIQNLEPYFELMKDTDFVFFYSPFSILYWDDQNQTNRLTVNRTIHMKVLSRLLQCDNVKVYFWDDQEMLDMICDLNNYADEMHSNFDVCENIIDRMKNGYGLLTENNYQQKINHFFDYLDSYDYDKIFV